MTAADRIRIGLVGAGSIAQVAELPALSARDDVTIAGLVTSTQESAQRNLERWPIEQAYPDVDAMLGEARLDALLVLTRKDDHTRFVAAGFRAGLDVFCEKPLASSLEDAQDMADLADKANRLLMVGFNRRYAEVYARAREELGSEVRFCVAQKNRPGSEYRATLENAIHMVDLLRWFCGEAEEVTAHAIAPDPYEEVGTMALIRFDTGAIGSLVAARCAGEWDERLDAYGGLTSARVTAPDAVAITRAGQTCLTEMRPCAMGWAQVTRTMGFGPEIDHFVDCVRDRRQPLTNGHDAVRTQALMDWIIREAKLPTEERENGS
jgi:virulence factor